MRTILYMLLITILSAPVSAETPPPQALLECSTATDGPLSLFCTPARGGAEFKDSWAAGGVPADATLTMRLFMWGAQGWEPVAGYPRDDMWLEGGGDWAPCWGGTVPDVDTDENGKTYWLQPTAVGGHLDAAQGDHLLVIVNGSAHEGSVVTNLSFNSADLNGDLTVNLMDVVLFTMDYASGDSYRSDFVWDGDVNLSDVVKMAESLGDDCP